jgi:GGDEF domain-containing protein
VPGTPIEDESTMYIPLIAGDRKLGVLNCSRGGLNRFTKEELEAASLFAHTAAAAWRNAQLYAELEERATTDPLTGLLNSRWLRDAGEREVEQARRSGQPLAVLLVDLDHFKEVNDSAGHAAGDTVLLAAARQLSGAVRAGDAAARLGGEEFLVILRDADAQGALRVAAGPADPGAAAGGVQHLPADGVDRHRRLPRARRPPGGAGACRRRRHVRRQAGRPRSGGGRRHPAAAGAAADGQGRLIGPQPLRAGRGRAGALRAGHPNPGAHPSLPGILDDPDRLCQVPRRGVAR